MRPAGEIHQALLKAAGELVALAKSPSKGPTLAEIADRACVGREAARVHVPKLKSRGHLKQVGDRRVNYRNRPVAEYAPKVLSLEDVEAMTGPVVLSNCMAGWTR